MQDAIGEWVNWLKINRSELTARSYDRHLRMLDTTQPDRKPADWTRAELLAYLAGRRARGNGDAALKQIVGALRSFFAYTCGQASPAAGIPFPRVKRRQQRVLNSVDLLKVLELCEASTPLGARDLAIITLMLDTGLRASELCRLRVKDVDLATRRLQVIIKGGNEGAAVYSPTTAQNIARWKSVRDEFARPECPALFVSIGGKRPGTQLTREGLKANFMHLAKRAGIVALSPHDLRRTFATLALRNGAPSRIVQAAGRWSSIVMVEHYSQTITAADFDPYSPVESVLSFRAKDDPKNER